MGGRPGHVQEVSSPHSGVSDPEPFFEGCDGRRERWFLPENVSRQRAWRVWPGPVFASPGVARDVCGPLLRGHRWRQLSAIADEVAAPEASKVDVLELSRAVLERGAELGVLARAAVDPDEPHRCVVLSFFLGTETLREPASQPASE